MTRLTITVASALGMAELAPTAPEERGVPDEYEPPKRLRFRRRDRFRPHGTDSVGIVLTDPQRNRRSVQFRYRHDPDTVHTLKAHEFNERFARIIPMRKPQKQSAQPRVLPQRRPLPAGLIPTPGKVAA